VSAAAPHVLVATPVAGGVVAHDYLHSVLNLQKHFDALGWSMEVVTRPDGLVTRSRNSFASVVVRHEKYSHLLMLDADVTVAPEGIERIIRSGYDFVGCVVPFREINWVKVRAHLDLVPQASAQDLKTMSTQYALWHEPKQKMVDGFIPVHAIGSAVMLVSRGALLAISESNLVDYATQGLSAADGNRDGWTFFDPFVDAEGVYLSEDYAFCDRWRSLGGTVWADLRTTTWHTGPVRIEGNIAASLRAATEYTRIAKERSAHSG